MPTTVDKNIQASGGDYATIALWEADTDNDLVTADQIQRGLLANETFALGTTAVTIAGATTDATRYRVLSTQTGASFRDNANVQTNALRANSANGAIITFTGTYATGGIVSTENYFRLSNVQITATGGTSGGALSITANTGSVVEFCIFEAVRNLASITIDSEGLKFLNCLVVYRGTGTPNPIASFRNMGGSPLICNSTFAVPSDKTAATNAIDSTYSTYTLKNCAFFGCSNVSTGGTPTFTTCYTDDATPPTGCTTATYANQFVAVADATRDYRVKDTSANIYDTGTTDATNAPIDIAKTNRPQSAAYDVGCWELVVAAGGAQANFMTLLGVGA